MVEDRLLRIREVVDRLAISRAKVFSLLATGEIPSLTIGRSRRVPLAGLIEWLDAREAASRTGRTEIEVAPEVQPGTTNEEGHHATRPEG